MNGRNGQPFDGQAEQEDARPLQAVRRQGIPPEGRRLRIMRIRKDQEDAELLMAEQDQRHQRQEVISCIVLVVL